MTKRNVRLIAESSDHGYSGQVTLDVVINNEKLKENTYCALWDDGETWPMLIHPNGTVDFGKFASSEKRIGQTDLYRKTIALGEYFSITAEGDEYTWKIKHLIDN